MMNVLFVFLGGGLGSLCRYGISKAIKQTDLHFPTATFVANVLSCIVLGYLIGLSLKEGISSPQRLLWMTGFCGGFSTFSTFSGETFTLLQGGATSTAFAYVFASVVVCVMCIWLGIWLSEKVI